MSDGHSPKSMSEILDGGSPSSMSESLGRCSPGSMSEILDGGSPSSMSEALDGCSPRSMSCRSSRSLSSLLSRLIGLAERDAMTGNETEGVKIVWKVWWCSRVEVKVGKRAKNFREKSTSHGSNLQQMDTNGRSLK